MNPCGRPRKEIDLEVALDLLMRGESISTVATELGVSPITLNSRIKEIQQKQGVLLQYRTIQSLQLTELQARILEAITPEKIADASLRDLVMSYKILKDKELSIEGKPTEIKGLVAHLIHLEKQEAVLAGQLPASNLIEYEESLEEQEEGLTISSSEGGNGTKKSSYSLAELDNQTF